MGIKAQNQVTILDITDSYSVILTNENQTFAETGYNSGAGVISTKTTVRAYRGSEEMWVWLASPVTKTDSQDSTLTITANKAATKSTKGLELTITTNKAGWKDSGSLSLPILVFDKEISSPTQSSDGYLVTITKEFSYSVAKYGNTGAAPTIYELDLTSIIFNYDSTTNSYTSPTSIEVTAKAQTGNSASQQYNNGIVIVTPYSSSGVAGPKQITVLSDVSGHKATINPSSLFLYYIVELNIGGTSSGSQVTGGSIVDRQTISTAIQGADGQDAYAIDIVSSEGLVFKNTGIATILTAHVYKGGGELTGYTDSYGFGSSTSPGPFVNWYIDDDVVGTGISFEVEDGDVASIATFTAKLEDEKGVIESGG